MEIKRFKWMAALWVLQTGWAPASTPAPGIPAADDLASTAWHAVRDCRPLLLEFAADHCEYCLRLEEEFLVPMHRNRDYGHRVVIRRVSLGTSESLVGFDNRPVDAAALAARYAVRVTPTLVFVDDRGEEIAESMIGYTTPELYGAYLDGALDKARSKLVAGESCDEGYFRQLFR